ncbi:MAG: zinc ABC transporter substrate-binding protein [Candidatus Hydrogenedentes bacterium]|nr:zinc ABC transporter substrate-binding protein [Candidatus Hydrogenedentota bacterium]
MKHCIRFVTATALAAAIFTPAFAAGPVKVAATLSTFADLARTVGGDHVDVSAVASPKFNPHFIEPKPSDVLRVKRAGLFIHAGLDLEVWRGPLVDAAGNPAVRPGGAGELDVSLGIPLLEVPAHNVTRAEGDIHLFGNPHYWLNPENARRMAETIAEKLATIDPEHAADYRKNFADFSARLDAKMAEWREKMKPYAGTELVGYHNEWPYLMEFLGLKIEYFLEPKPGIPPTPKQTQFLEKYIPEKHIKAIVQASYFPTRAAQALADRTGAKLVMLCQSVGENSEAGDYIGTIDYDVNALVQALQ